MAATLSYGSSNRLDDPQTGRSRRRVWARGLAVAVCASAALAGPGNAHAAAPSLGGLDAQVQSAVDQVNTVAPAAVASVQPAVDQALAAASAPVPSTPPAATTPESAPRAPESVPSTPASSPPTSPVSPADVIEPVIGALATATSAAAAMIPVPTSAPAGRRAAAPTAKAHRSRPTRGAPAAAAAPVETIQSLSQTPSAALAAGALAPPRAETVGDRVERSRTRHKPAAGANSLPQRLPPQSPLPQPDAGAPGLGGGGGSPPLLLLFAALTAGFALFGFRVHHRRLPRTAFLKPRRVVLAVWHPG